MVRAPPPVLGVDAGGRGVRAAPQSAAALRGGESSDGSSGHELHPDPRAGTPVRALARERPAYFDPALVIRDTEKQGLAMLFRSPGVIKRLAGFLVEHADPAYLLPV